MTARILATLVLTALSLAACAGGSASTATSAHAPEPIAENECASCGMIVREQPTPRGQLVHRDGTHAWFCSIADLVAYAGSPSPHGRVERIWVEGLSREVDPGTHEHDEARWIDATHATFVLGVERNMVMGAPALSFESAEDARAVAERLGARTASWDETQRELGGGAR